MAVHLFSSRGDCQRSGTCGPGNLDPEKQNLLGPTAQTFDLGPSQPLSPQNAPHSTFACPGPGSRKAGLSAPAQSPAGFGPNSSVLPGSEQRPLSRSRESEPAAPGMGQLYPGNSPRCQGVKGPEET